MKTPFPSLLLSAQLFCLLLLSCGGENTTDALEDSPATLHPAFAAFDQDSFDIVLNGNQVNIETNGLPIFCRRRFRGG